MKKILTSIILIVLCSFSAQGQTNVSGGIYSNTTWTLANSPYIVTDTVVVFPNVVLTIQPGVVVKFADNQQLELRQSQLVAIGNATDSITFTSNSTSPTPGIYVGIYLNGGGMTSTFSYCNVKYATTGVDATVTGALDVDHSVFTQNVTGLQFVGNTTSQSAAISTTDFTYSSAGLALENLYSANVSFCNFSHDFVYGFVMGNPANPSQFSCTTSNCNFTSCGDGILFNMVNASVNSCNFSNNNYGIIGGTQQMNFVHVYPVSINNCVCRDNQTGMHLDHILINGCTINHNQTGYDAGGVSRIKNCTVDSNVVVAMSIYNDSVINCNVKYNADGISPAGGIAVIKGSDIEYNSGYNIHSGAAITVITGNTVSYGGTGIENVTGNFTITSNVINDNNLGVVLNSSTGTFSCNRICDNATYDLQYGASGNFDASHNYWCTPDSASTEVLIYDGYDNVNDGLVSFLPFDTTCIPNVTTSIHQIAEENLFNIFPNPASDYLTVNMPATISNGQIKIFNMLGETEYAVTTASRQTEIDVKTWAAGIYIIQIESAGKTVTRKFVKQ